MRISNLNKANNQELQKWRSITRPHKEAIVVFNKLSIREQFLNEYAKYSHWWTSASKMPERLRLNKEYSFKVEEALEPCEYQIEYKYSSKWISILIIILVYVLIGLI